MKKNDGQRGKTQELAILKGAVENTNEAFVTIDENHTVIFFNQAAERIFGYSRDEVIGQDLNVILTPNCSRDHRQAVARYVETRIPRRIGHETELTATRKNGEIFPISISFSVAKIEGRLFFTGIIRDLAETKALQEQVSQAERLAALGQLVAEIAHEIKNPLVVIGGYVQQLIRTIQEEKSVAKLRIIAEEVKRLENLLSELSEYYLPRKLHLERFDMNGMLREICSLTKPESEEKNIRLECQIEAYPAWVEGDRDKLRQVLLNLIRNGIQAMERGGNLSIQATLGDRIEIKIADEGLGIPESQQTKIFTPFFTTKRGGMGLGLAICKKIIEGHPGSTIELTSQEGKGTIFKITMPFFPS